MIDAEIRKVCGRGHIDVSVSLKTLSSSATLTVDENLLMEYRKASDRICELTGALPMTVSDYVSIDGIIVSRGETDVSIFRSALLSALSCALSGLGEAKKREGEGTRRDLRSLGGKLREGLFLILSKKDEMEAYFRNILLEKYEELLGEKGEDDPRFLSEVASLLVKYSINEECSRLRVHMERYDELVESETAQVGKELDFLCQEMNREINTAASKSQMVEINLAVVRMKDALEDIREQVRNIE